MDAIDKSLIDSLLCLRVSLCNQLKFARRCRWLYHQLYLVALSFSAVCFVIGIKALFQADLVLAFASILSVIPLYKSGVFCLGLAKEWRDFQAEIKADIFEIDSQVKQISK